MKLAYVALGSNLADPVAQVQRAMLALEQIPNTRVLNKSSLYQTAPIGYAHNELAQVPDFINAVAVLETDLSPLALLQALLAIEDRAGRVRPYPNAPRVLDCDLLLFADVILNTEQLTLPHPRMHLRGFVLLPLFEIAPQLSIENHGKIEQLINAQLKTGIEKLNA